MRIMLARQMNVLGWMGAPAESLAQWDDHAALAAAVRADGLSRTLVCGMGGSSLVADVLAAAFDVKQLQVLDSTNPDAVRAARSEEHTSELQSRENLVCRLLLE